MKTFLPTLFALIGIAVVAGIVLAVNAMIARHYAYKAKHGYMSEEDADKYTASGKKTTLIAAAIILALSFVGAVNNAQIETARKEEQEKAKEEREGIEDTWFEKGYINGYDDGYSDGHLNGYDDGYDDGYKNGYYDGERD